jgi:hypothetical protein
VLLHRGANLLVGILMKLQQALRQLTIVESACLQQICHHSLVLASLDQVAYAASLVLLGTDIEIPARLAEFMKGKKQSIEMTKDFASFKNYLMNE